MQMYANVWHLLWRDLLRWQTANVKPNPNPYTTLNQKPNDNPRSYTFSPEISDTVEPRYNEVLGTMKMTLLYQVSHYIRVKKQRNYKRVLLYPEIFITRFHCIIAGAMVAVANVGSPMHATCMCTYNSWAMIFHQVQVKLFDWLIDLFTKFTHIIWTKVVPDNLIACLRFVWHSNN